MIPLQTRLDTVDFDELLRLASAQLPALAPAWTDYNIHDPGIMLVELLAWLADSQIYSLGRDRQDERLAMLRLLGRRARGAVPARGTIFPDQPPTHARPVSLGQRIAPTKGGAPPLENVTAITLLPLAIASVTTRGPGGVADHTRTNLQARASFEPFGRTADSELHLAMAAVAGSAPIVPGSDGTVRLSIGVRLEQAGLATQPSRLGRIAITLADGTPLRRLRDTSFAFQRTGVIVLALTPQQLAQPIVIRPLPGYALRPRIVELRLNALPVEQRLSLTAESQEGTGLPGQLIEIVPSTLASDDRELQPRAWQLVDSTAALQIRSTNGDDWLDWTCGQIDAAEPGDRVFWVQEAADGSRIAVRFGNGVNGLRPAAGGRIETRLRLSCGELGNAAAGVEWVVPATAMTWRNAEKMAGGRFREDAKTALAALRRHLDQARPLATSANILDAARSLPPAFGLDRAEVFDGWERGRRVPATPATRTLVAMTAEPGGEDPAWLAAIRRRIAPRLAIGERLLVVAPRYRRFSVVVEAVAASGADIRGLPAAIAKAVADRLKPTGEARPRQDDVSANAIAGWVRRIAGVARVVAVRISGEGAAEGVLPIGRGEVPLLDPAVKVLLHGARQ